MELYGTLRLGEKFRNFMELFLMCLMERNDYDVNVAWYSPQFARAVPVVARSFHPI